MTWGLWLTHSNPRFIQQWSLIHDESHSLQPVLTAPDDQLEEGRWNLNIVRHPVNGVVEDWALKNAQWLSGVLSQRSELQYIAFDPLPELYGFIEPKVLRRAVCKVVGVGVGTFSLFRRTPSGVRAPSQVTSIEERRPRGVELLVQGEALTDAAGDRPS